MIDLTGKKVVLTLNPIEGAYNPDTSVLTFLDAAGNSCNVSLGDATINPAETVIIICLGKLCQQPPRPA